MEPLLRMEDMWKSFGGVVALRGVDFEVRAGEIMALVGENGAGKSTLMKILGGAYQMDRGRVSIEGRPVALTSPRDAQRLGIYIVHQELNLVPGMSIAENILLGRFPVKPVTNSIDWAGMRSAAGKVLERLGVNLDPRRRVGELSVAEQQLVEIGKALSASARILVMDEPTAALVSSETHRLFGIMRELKNRGIGIVFISHRLGEVFELADRVTVLRDGGLVGVRDIGDVTTQGLISMMIGREMKDLFPKSTVPVGEVALSVAGLSDGRGFHDVSFDVRRGEILGIAGLVGSGRTEIARTLFGASRRTAGTVRLFDSDYDPRNPAGAITAGLGFVTEDRKGEGIVASLPVAGNIALASIKRITRAGRVSGSLFRSLVDRFVTLMKIVTSNAYHQKARELSGGNQQKVVMARWLACNPRLLIVDEPTRGVDVGTKSEIHRMMGDFVASGRSIIMISSELAEVIAASDRVLVMHEGRVAAILDRSRADQATVAAYAMGEQGWSGSDDHVGGN